MVVPRSIDPKLPRGVVARVSIEALTPALFRDHFLLRGVPCVIQGAIRSDVSQWRLGTFASSLESSGTTYACRIHGGDSFATTPQMWRGRSHARHVVRTTPQKFAETITSGVGAREDCYVQADIQGTAAAASVGPSSL